MTRRGRRFGLFLAALALALVSGPVLLKSVDVAAGGVADQARRVVTANLVVEAGTTVVSPEIALDGFAIWTTQVSIRSGLATDFQWRQVHRMRNDLEWVPGTASFGASFVSTDRVRAPFGAIEFRNLGGESVTVALSAFLDRRDTFIDGRRVAATSVVVQDPITIPPGQFRFAPPVALSGASRFATQLSFPGGHTFPPGSFTTSYEAKIFDPQSFASLGGGSVTDRNIGDLLQVYFPTMRLKITNGSAQVVDVIAAHYLLTSE